MIISCQKCGIQGNSAKSTINPMSSFGLIEENMELSHTDEAVLSLLIPKKYSLLEAYKLKEAVMKVVQVPEPLWAEMTQPLGRPLGAK